MAVPSLSGDGHGCLPLPRSSGVQSLSPSLKTDGKGSDVTELWPLSASETGRSFLLRQVRDGTGEIPFI